MKALVAMVSVACAVSCAPAHHGHAIVTQWMLQDCRVGEPDMLQANLRAVGEDAERALLRYYEDGPDSSPRDDVAAEAGREYDEIIAALNAGRTYGLSSGQIASIRADSRPAYVRAALDDFDNGFRAAALNGLAVVGRPRGIALLRSVAKDPHSSDRQAAITALAAAGIPLTPP